LQSSNTSRRGRSNHANESSLFASGIKDLHYWAHQSETLGVASAQIKKYALN